MEFYQHFVLIDAHYIVLNSANLNYFCNVGKLILTNYLILKYKVYKVYKSYNYIVVQCR